VTDQPAPAWKKTMMAVETTGNGGYDRLAYRAVATPVPGPGEVLIQVLAAGMNNTEINTRLGWYSSSVTTDTEGAAQAQDEKPRKRAMAAGAPRPRSP